VLTIRSLLDELSFEGNAKKYRGGGRGLENVLTTEVFSALEYLPRDPFLAGVFDAAEIFGVPGMDQDAVQAAPANVWTDVRREVESFVMTVLPGDAHAPDWETQVQPDVLITSPADYVFVEAKGTRRGASFQPEQLYREMLVADANRDGRRATLLVVTAEPPPVLVAGHGRRSLADAVARGHELFQRRHIGAPPPWSLPVTLAHVTWARIAERVMSAAEKLRGSSLSKDLAICRLADAVNDAVRWHQDSERDPGRDATAAPPARSPAVAIEVPGVSG
jgi:hypothetical protein